MKRAVLFLIVFGVALVGCDGDLLVDNTDPNATTDPSMSGLLSTAILSTSTTTQGAASVTSYYVQHLASPSGSATDQQFEARFGGTWSSVYDGLGTAQALIEKADEGGVAALCRHRADHSGLQPWARRRPVGRHSVSGGPPGG
jgi:hypothetical protein